MSAAPKILCVDLDGTLLRSDLLLETFFSVIKRRPLDLLRVPGWLVRGKAALKAELAQRARVDAATLPYDERFLAWLREQRAAGRELWLCTASNYRPAQAVAEHLGLFAGVIASTDEHNLSGRAKARELEGRFGAKAFDYCGNESVDLHVWRSSRAAVVVNAGAGVERAARALGTETAVFAPQGGVLRHLVRALRPHQWAKNALVFVPLLAAHKTGSIAAFIAALLAFLAFSACASSVYVINDLLDLESDRQHPRKRLRPFAAGNLSIMSGIVLAPLLLAGAAVLAYLLPRDFALVLAAYFVLTLAYSFELKRIAVLDILALAGLYTSRIVAGAAAVNVPLSFWLLLFSVFLFVSLALVKRFAELEALRRAGKLKASGRGYRVEDLPILHSMGTASGYASVLVLALYINSPAVDGLYRNPKAMWMLCIVLLYWISRVWIKAHRGQMHDDPLVYALKDPVSLATGALAAVAVLFAV